MTTCSLSGFNIEREKGKHDLIVMICDEENHGEYFNNRLLFFKLKEHIFQEL